MLIKIDDYRAVVGPDEGPDLAVRRLPPQRYVRYVHPDFSVRGGPASLPGQKSWAGPEGEILEKSLLRA